MQKRHKRRRRRQLSLGPLLRWWCCCDEKKPGLTQSNFGTDPPKLEQVRRDQYFVIASANTLF